MDNQLPDEVVEEINKKAKEYSSNASATDWKNGATEYACKLLQEQQDRAHEVALLKEVNNEALKLTEKAQNEIESLTNQLRKHSNVADENMNLLRQEQATLQSKCDKYEKERYETRLAMRMLLRAFKGDIKTERHKEWYAKAEAIFNKYHNVADALRNEALSGEGDRICPSCNKAFNADRHGNCRECGSDEYKQKEDK